MVWQCDSTEAESNVYSLLTALKSCSKQRDLTRGEQLHATAIRSGHLSNTFVASTLVDMYAKCGNLDEARKVFERMLLKNTITWNCIIMGYADNGQSEMALELYRRMQDEGCTPDRVTVIAALKACASLAKSGLERGKNVHAQAVKSGFAFELSVANTLVNMYGKCGSMIDAYNVFKGMPHRDVISWNCIMGGYLQTGDSELALQIFSRMQDEGYTPSAVTFVAALKACAALAATEGSDRACCLEKGKAIHAAAVKLLGKGTDIFVANILIDMYAKCGSMTDSRKVFESLQQPTVVSWTALIAGYSQCQGSELALELYARMQDEGCRPNAFTYVAALGACANLGAKEEGRRIHLQAAKDGLDKQDVFVANSLVDMYSKCGSLADARLVFEAAACRNSVLWSCIILAYAQAGEGTAAFDLFTRMLREERCEPNAATFIAAAKACSALAVKENGRLIEGKFVKVDSLEKGIGVHFRAVKMLETIDMFVASTLVEMYSKCGTAKDAWKVFRGIAHPNIVLWNCIIQAHADSEAEKALELFSRVHAEGLVPDTVTFMAAVQACLSLLESRVRTTEVCLETCRCIHSLAARCGYDRDNHVGNTLVDVYGKCASLEDAQQAFQGISDHDLVSWNCYMTAYLQCCKAEEALLVYDRIQDAGFRPSASTYVAALKACSNMGNLEAGRQLHAEICSAGLQHDASVSISLMDFYGRCGSMVEAEKIFGAIVHKELRAWNTLLCGYSRQGSIQRAFDTFDKMCKSRLQPDEVTFLCILTMCSHAGLVDEGKKYFEAMRCEYGILPGVKHYTCLVDLLGRVNELEEALKLVQRMPVQGDRVLWMTLLNAAQKWNNAEVGKLAFEAVVRLDRASNISTPYVMMSNIFENI